MKRISCSFYGACLLLAAASAAQAATSPGSNFDGNMSLIYDVNSGNVFLENAPLANPAVRHLVLQSLSNLFIPGNLNLPSLSPPVTVNSATANLLDIEWSSGNFLGTGSFLGDILPAGLSEPFLLNDLTIQWAQGGTPLKEGDLLYAKMGNWQGDPVLPRPGSNGFFGFFDVATGQFFDPPVTYGYEFNMLGESLFTMVGLPVGFGDNFTITSSEGTVSGLYGGGMHVFSGGVSSFTLTGIDPMVDPNDPQAFPTYLEFNTATASFTMTPLVVPEPSSIALVGSALVFCHAATRRKK